MSTFRFEDPQMAPVSRATWAACQARIAAVIALCDATATLTDDPYTFVRDIRAAATGDTT